VQDRPAHLADRILLGHFLVEADEFVDRRIADGVHLILPAAFGGEHEHLERFVFTAGGEQQFAMKVRVGLFAFDDVVFVVHVRALDAAVEERLETADAQPVIAEVRREHRRACFHVGQAEAPLHDAQPLLELFVLPEFHIRGDVVGRRAGFGRRGDAECGEHRAGLFEPVDQAFARYRRQQLAHQVHRRTLDQEPGRFAVRIADDDAALRIDGVFADTGEF